jgi:hypothetical protein
VKTICFATLVATFICATQATAGEPLARGLTYDQALAVARQAAVKRGFDMKEYSLLNSGPEPNRRGRDWSFLYVCKQPDPDCGFSVDVDSSTAATEVRSLPGGNPAPQR